MTVVSVLAFIVLMCVIAISHVNVAMGMPAVFIVHVMVIELFLDKKARNATSFWDKKYGYTRRDVRDVVDHFVELSVRDVGYTVGIFRKPYPDSRRGNLTGNDIAIAHKILSEMPNIEDADDLRVKRDTPKELPRFFSGNDTESFEKHAFCSALCKPIKNGACVSVIGAGKAPVH
jgi:hypothetical protein